MIGKPYVCLFAFAVYLVSSSPHVLLLAFSSLARDANRRTNKIIQSSEKHLKQNMDHTTAEHEETRKEFSKELQKSAQKQDRKMQKLQTTMDTILHNLPPGPKGLNIDCATTTTASTGSSWLESEEYKSRDELLEENRRLKARNEVLSTPIAKRERIETRRDAAKKKHIQNLRNQNNRTKY